MLGKGSVRSWPGINQPPWQTGPRASFLWPSPFASCWEKVRLFAARLFFLLLLKGDFTVGLGFGRCPCRGTVPLRAGVLGLSPPGSDSEPGSCFPEQREVSRHQGRFPPSLLVSLPAAFCSSRELGVRVPWEMGEPLANAPVQLSAPHPLS